MPLEIYPREQIFRNEPTARLVLEHLIDHQDDLDLANAFIFCNFPLFREENEILYAKFIIVSPLHGVILISTLDAAEDQKAIGSSLEGLEGTFSQIFSKLVKYSRLRSGRAMLAMPLDAIAFSQEAVTSTHKSSDLIAVGFVELESKLAGIKRDAPLSDEIIAEILSVVDGSKALIRAPERNVADYPPSAKVARIKALEEEIRRFDRDQRIAYMSPVHGTQRIRGLAGSGKTVVLAMKAAMTHVRDPEARIAFTFYTKSLYQHVKQLITRFYRLHDDKDPDWTKLRILHAWGGGLAEGFYSFAAKAHNEVPLTFGHAKAFDPAHPFDFACKRLLQNSSLSSLFDYVFVDEAQDFPPSFLRLALRLAEEEKLVIAYDALQTIFDVDVPTAGVLFGTDERGEPDVLFDEDIVLHKCYRNSREVLMCAHALGFGLYGPKIIQMLESKEHWEDFGYKVISGQFNSGEHVRIERPVENSPNSISANNTIEDLIQAKVFKSFAEEIEFISKSIKEDIQTEGVSPEDILVICADDKNVRVYFRELTTALNEFEINCNNLQDDTYGLRDFTREKKVTLSTIYKAKGNEAYIVYMIGIDALFFKNNARTRNMVFTGMTRAKGWLRVSGVGPDAEAYSNELNKAKNGFPYLDFEFPSPEQLFVMKRDLSHRDESALEEALHKLEENFSDEEYEQMLTKKLREIRSRKRIKAGSRKSPK